MDQLGTDFNATGSVMTLAQKQEQRRKRGECVTCGQKCYQKKLFKMVALTIHGKVLNGRCLDCHPLDSTDAANSGVAMPAVSRPATEEDVRRFRLKQEQLRPASSRNLESTASSNGSVASAGRQRARPGLTARSASVSVASFSVTGGSAELPQQQQQQLSHSNSHSADRGFSNRSLQAHRSSSIASGVSLASHHSSDSFAAEQPQQPQQHYHRGPERSPEDNLLPTSPNAVEPRRSYPGPLSLGGRRRQSSGERHETDTSQQSFPSTFDHSLGDGAVDDFRIAMEDILGSRVDEEEAYALLSSGREPTQILEDLRLQQQDADVASGYDDADYAQDEYFHHQQQQQHDLHHGSLDRGGAVPSAGRGDRASFSSLSTPAGGASYGHASFSNRSLSSSHGNFHASSSSGFGVREHSTRSFDSSELLVHHHHHHPGRERGSGSSQFRRASSSSMQSPRSHHGRASLTDHFSGNRSTSRSSDLDHSAHSDAYSASARSRTGHQGDMVRHRSDHSVERSVRDDTEGGLDRLNEAGADYVAVVSIMRDYPGSAEVQLNCMEELSNFNFADEDFDMLMDVGAMEVVVDAMQAFPRDVVLQMSGCRAMCNTCATLEANLCYTQLGAVDLILDAMGLFLEEPRMQENGLAALANLAAAQENVQELLDKGCVPQTVAAMNTYSEDTEVQLKACSVISNLSSHPLDVANAIMEANAGGAVVLAMVLHSQEPDVQEKALHALLNLSANSDDVKVGLAHMGGLDAAIQAMQVHRDDAAVQECAANLLFVLAAVPENKVQIGQSGGIDVIIRAMWVHSESVSVTEWCCRALFAVSLHAENAKKVLDVGGITAVVNAMQAHAESALVQEMCCAVLCSLAMHDDGAKETIVTEEALDAIVLAMVLFGDDGGVQEQACLVLLQLANETNLRSMQASNVGELAMTAAMKFPDRCREIANELSHILDGLTATYNSSGAAIVATGD